MLAAADRLIHQATILEMNVKSYGRKEALARKRSRGPAKDCCSTSPSAHRIESNCVPEHSLRAHVGRRINGKAGETR
jgi:hypothetical protein